MITHVEGNHLTQTFLGEGLRGRLPVTRFPRSSLYGLAFLNSFYWGLSTTTLTDTWHGWCQSLKTNCKKSTGGGGIAYTKGPRRNLLSDDEFL